METLPWELIQLISYYLPPNVLLVNHSLTNLYTDIWYREYLNFHYPSVNLWVQTNYKDLYKKSVLQQKIFITTDFITYNEFSVQCVDACLTYHDGKKLMLTFNGDLYLDTILISTKVVSINPFGYITCDKWYIFDPFNSQEIIMGYSLIKSGTVQYWFDTYIYVMSSHAVHIYSFRHKKISTIYFDKIKDVANMDQTILVLEDNGNLYKISNDLSGKNLLLEHVDYFHGDGFITKAALYIIYDRFLSTLNPHINYTVTPVSKILVLGEDHVIILDNQIVLCQTVDANEEPRIIAKNVQNIFRHLHYLYLSGNNIITYS